VRPDGEILALVLASAVIALSVSAVTAAVVTAVFFDDSQSCHDCEGCNP